MLYYIPLSIILICLVIIIFIIVRKFPQVANLDVDNLQEELELKKKEEIISKRIENEAEKMKKRWKQRFVPLRKIWGQVQLKFRIYVGKIERLWHHEETLKKKEKIKSLSSSEKRKEISLILQQAEQKLKEKLYDDAEELYISAIKLDVKSVLAYRGLADNYLEKNSIDEAIQTYMFLLQLSPHDDDVMVKLGDIFEENNEIGKAIDYYKKATLTNDSLSPRFYHLAELFLKVEQFNQAKESIIKAVEIEPKNPKYLDLLIEVAIICCDKTLANKAYEDLRLVNPENQKLSDFKEQIEAIK